MTYKKTLRKSSAKCLIYNSCNGNFENKIEKFKYKICHAITGVQCKELQGKKIMIS